MLTTTQQSRAQSGPIGELGLRDATLADLARRCGGTLLGKDRPVRHLRPISAPAVPGALTFAADGRFVRAFLDGEFEAAIVRAADVGLVDTSDRSLVVHRDPRESFYALHVALVEEGRYGTIESARDRDADIAPSAVVHVGVRIGHGVRIDEGAVIYPNTIVGDGVAVAAGSVIGGGGLRVESLGGRRRRVPHAGGVILADGVAVGSQSCVARGLFSDFTTIGAETMIGDLVRVAPDVRIGARCTLAAGSGTSHRSEVEDDVGFDAGAVCTPFVRIGRGALVGTGAVVVGDVDPFTLMEGNPARAAAQVCLCRTRLSIGDEWVVRCRSCGRQYAAPNGVLDPL